MKNTTEYRTAYAERDDMTFILKETQDGNGNPVSTEVVGFYYGTPDEDDTARYIGALKAEY